MIKPSNQPNQSQNHDDGGITFEVVELETAQNARQGDNKLSRGVYLVPNLITTASMLCAFFSIISSSEGAYYKAALAIFLSAVLDGMDGRAARMLDAQSPFGEQFDSLADCVAFGLAPAVLVYQFALHGLGRFGLACAFVFSACAAFRLARFNVQVDVVDKKYFIGLASPLAAILIASSVMMAIDHTNWLGSVGTHIGLAEFIFAVWTVMCGLLMVSNVKYYSFKEFDRQKVPFVALIIGVFVMGAVLYDLPVGILAIGMVYALSGIVTTILTKTKASRQK
ncbi:CDP-diacylglycerol--serine O-phosphatidyltransferase [Moraxella nasovis]|uniref:CDP-diacylglycerol--serine O-phosphatidyltransferase n=1 Tax=Moraxella nasovis TaxID=2904121 RepID=UPI001F6244CE|nr:CDP-diacylglycerol--serine O-phosphatidyltransferase [Moraxella nasovis]UNU72818.1 CDP-diacylglycerol--serine O-phosphatidyltransferase [Moraxella nasovis]